MSKIDTCITHECSVVILVLPGVYLSSTRTVRPVELESFRLSGQSQWCCREDMCVTG